MWTAADILRVLLFACLFIQLILAALFLRGRKMSTFSYLLWGVLAIVLPLLGPYLVIASRPGKARKRRPRSL